MQEIALILSSLAGGVATAAAIRRAPKNKNQLLSLGASSQIRSQINSLKIEKDILTKTISRLYQTDSEFSKIQKDKLLLKYQHQLGVILAKLEKLEAASKHPDLGPVGDGLITLMDQKLSSLDDRLYELSSKITSAKIDSVTSTQKPSEETQKQSEPKQKFSQSIKETFTFEKADNKDNIADSAKTNPFAETTKQSSSLSPKPRQSFEFTTLTNVSKTQPKESLFEEIQPKKEIVKKNLEQETIKEVPSPSHTESIKKTTLQESIGSEITPAKEEPKTGSQINLKTEQPSKLEPQPDLRKQVAKITEHKALPEPKPQEKPKTKPLDAHDDEFYDDTDDLEKIKGDIMRVLSKLDQAEVE
ncbi:hypothetical protein [Nitrosopumilus sp.]|uniref:hypothetical protein n=1 Tax=Nitrosopumilus sp. TaxID=2024843 RepID=UPI003B59FE88